MPFEEQILREETTQNLAQAFIRKASSFDFDDYDDDDSNLFFMDTTTNASYCGGKAYAY